MRRLTVLALSTGIATALATIASASADAATLAYPSGVHVSSATSTSYTVSMARASGATGYRVYTASTQAALYVSHITSSTKHATSSRPSVTLGGYHYTSAVLWYRVETLRGTSHRWDSVPRPAGLKPPTPTGVTGHDTATGSYLTWAGQSTGSGFVVARATNAAMTTGRSDLAVGRANSTFSPYGLSAGHTYYFRVRALNGPVASGWSSQVALTPRVAQARLLTTTYNVLENTFDRTPEGGTTVSPWSARGPAAAALLTGAKPDLIAVEEAAAWVGSVHGRGGRRQVDDLVARMPGYSLARTEIPPTEAGYMRTGNYILYRRASVTPVGAGGHFEVKPTSVSSYTAYQMFRTTTGAELLFTSSHLFTGNGRSGDDIRMAQTQSLIQQATARAGGHPIVYAGDFNSNDYLTNHVYNAPVKAMAAAHIVDARSVAGAKYDNQYNSANQYLRSPAKGGYDIDYVFGTPGVSVRSWGQLMKMSGSKFAGTIPSDHNPVWAWIGISS